jgi:hypothetical protein
MANHDAKNPSHKLHVRDKIRGTLLLNRLQDNALADEEFMTANQIASARIVLAKWLPDLANVQVSGDADQPLAVQIAVKFAER